MFASFDIIGKRVGRSDQETMLDEMLNDDGGWTAFVCSAPEYGRLFAYQMMRRYLEGDGARIEWHRVTGSRYDKHLDERKQGKKPHLLILDSLLTHPPMHPNGARGYDPTRVGKIHDIVNMYRGVSSIIVLCPELDPEQAYHMSNIQADMMLYMMRQYQQLEL
ncbi:hypothetical protein EVB87_234 [Rhizobium phage RHph_N28_1]|nr:hypothetical protein EVB87_234 [Rhizobium phage RHph_N28_1]QIG74263.1 hypothetical protein EVC07_235 [Rhizobium phage RHph_N42]QIG74873.1 hypothetical protein EVC12_238 [Rhizobium phage RHph_I42]QXV73923.1 hypothetical protein [Rhizobium phage RHph_N46]